MILHTPQASPLGQSKKFWRNALHRAEYPGKLFHEFRRTAVRNLERAAVPRSTAMAMVGHKTESIYRRYAIVDEAMHREASAKLDAWAESQSAPVGKPSRGQVKRFHGRPAAR